jgi:DNA-directed RNA polymerase specialized sigma24 family protein
MAKDRSISESRAKVSSRWQISHDGFAGLLAALGGTPQEAGQHYEQLRSKLVFFFTRRSLQSPEDLADEVLDRLARRLSEGLTISSVDGFVLGVARHVAQEQAAIRNQPQSVDPSFFDNVPAVLDTPIEDERIADLERCLRRLPSLDTQLLRNYYLGDANHLMSARKRMAERLGVSPGTLRQRVFLIRKRLLDCVTTSLQKRRR